MTSTNDRKNVKSNQSIVQKGKTYYIELYKSLEGCLSSTSQLSLRAEALCSAWSRIHCLCLHSASSTQPHLLAWLQKHSAKILLQTEWQSPSSAAFKTSLEYAINGFINEARDAAKGRQNFYAWETSLVRRAQWFLSILHDPWGHPVLKKLLDPKGDQPEDSEVIQWLKEERGVIFVLRLRQLASSKCDDLALILVTAVMDRVRADELYKDVTEKNKFSRNKICDILTTEAGFTNDVWELLTDLEFILLHKSGKTTKCIELIKKIPLLIVKPIMERLSKRLETLPKEKKIWKNAQEVAILITNVTIARCMVCKTLTSRERDVLRWGGGALARLLTPARLRTAAAALAVPALTPTHLYELAAAVHEQCQQESMKPFVCELYVRSITAGMNDLERLKLKTEKESEARKTEQTIASWFIKLGSVFSQSHRIYYECMLTAFSVHPSQNIYDQLCAAPALAPVKLEKNETDTETKSEFGSWANDSHSQTNLVKNSETLNLKQTKEHQANVLSTALLTEGETLGLEAVLCQDLAVLLSGPRVKTLSWDMDREKLLENCRAYMEVTGAGTKVLTKELKYLNLDPSEYSHLPEEDDGEDDIYYGIEKGYEHLVELPNPEPEEIWPETFSDFERAESVCSGEDQFKKKYKKTTHSSDEDDPLSTHREKLKSNFEQKNVPKTKNRSREPSLSKERKKEAREKPKKERKKRNKDKNKSLLLPQPPLSISSLIGLKVCTETEAGVKSREKKHCSDSNNDNHCKSSLSFLEGTSESNVLFDGLFSMDDLKTISPSKNSTISNINESPKYQCTPQVIQPYPLSGINNPIEERRVNSPVRDDVRDKITKLIQFRKQKQAATAHNNQDKSRNPDTKSMITNFSNTLEYVNTPKTSYKQHYPTHLATINTDAVKIPQNTKGSHVVKPGVTKVSGMQKFLNELSSTPDKPRKRTPKEKLNIYKEEKDKMFSVNTNLNSLNKSDTSSLISQCAKLNVKKVEEAPKTFARLNYEMHACRNKQVDNKPKRNQIRETNTGRDAMSQEIERNFAKYKQQRLAEAKSKNDKPEPNHQTLAMNPELRKLLSNQVKGSEALKEHITNILKPASSARIQFTNSIDQKEFLSLVQQRNKLNSINTGATNTPADKIPPVIRKNQSSSGAVNQFSGTSIKPSNNIITPNSIVTAVIQDAYMNLPVKPTTLNNTIVQQNKIHKGNYVANISTAKSNTGVQWVEENNLKSPVKKSIQSINTNKPSTSMRKNSETEVYQYEHTKLYSANRWVKQPDQIQRDLENVMDKLLSHRTPSRGPNALDMALNKKSLNTLRQQRIPKPKLENNDNTKSVIVMSDSIISKEKVMREPNVIPPLVNIRSDTTILEAIPSQIVIQKQQKSRSSSNISKNACQVNVQSNRVDAKPIPVCTQANDEFALLDEIMDKDLLKEIEELSSDEDSPTHKKVANEVKLNIATKHCSANTVSQSHNVQAKKTVYDKYIGYNLKTKTTNSLLVPDEKPKINKVQMPLLKDTQSTIVPSPSTSSKIIHNQQPKPQYCLTNNNTLTNETPSVVIASMPLASSAPNVVLLRPNVIAYPTIQVQETYYPTNISNENTVLVNTPNIALYQTTQYTAPVVNHVIVGNAITINTSTAFTTSLSQGSFTKSPAVTKCQISIETPTPSISSEPAVNMNESIAQQTITKAQLATERIPTLPQKYEFSADIKQETKIDLDNSTKSSEKKDFSEMKGNSSKTPEKHSTERKVLSEVQENVSMSEKSEPKTEELPKFTVESNKLIKEEHNQLTYERIIKKRQAIINREINCRLYLPPIPLLYEKLQIPESEIKVSEKLSKIKNKIKDSTCNNNSVSNICNNSASQEIEIMDETKSLLLPDLEVVSMDSAKENNNTDLNRKQLRSSNKNNLKSKQASLKAKIIKKTNATPNSAPKKTRSRGICKPKEPHIDKVTEEESKHSPNRSSTRIKIMKENEKVKLEKENEAKASSNECIEIFDFEDKILGCKIPIVRNVIPESEKSLIIPVQNGDKLDTTGFVKDPLKETVINKVLPKQIKSESHSEVTDPQYVTRSKKHIPRTEPIAEVSNPQSKIVKTNSTKIHEGQTLKKVQNTTKVVNTKEINDSKIDKSKTSKNSLIESKPCRLSVLGYTTVPAQNGDPTKKIVRLLLPTNRVIKVTIYGDIDINLNSLLAMPDIKNILRNNREESKKYLLNVETNSTHPGAKVLSIDELAETTCTKSGNLEEIEKLKSEKQSKDKEITEAKKLSTDVKQQVKDKQIVGRKQQGINENRNVQLKQKQNNVNLLKGIKDTSKKIVNEIQETKELQAFDKSSIGNISSKDTLGNKIPLGKEKQTTFCKQGNISKQKFERPLRNLRNKKLKMCINDNILQVVEEKQLDDQKRLAKVIPLTKENESNDEISFTKHKQFKRKIKLGKEKQFVQESAIPKQKYVLTDEQSPTGFNLTPEKQLVLRNKIAEAKTINLGTQQESQKQHPKEIQVKDIRLPEEKEVLNESQLTGITNSVEDTQTVYKNRLGEVKKVIEQKNVAEEKQVAEDKQMTEEKQFSKELQVLNESQLASKNVTVQDTKVVYKNMLGEVKQVIEQKNVEEKQAAIEKQVAEEKLMAEEKQLAKEQEAYETQDKILAVDEFQAAEEKQVAEENASKQKKAAKENQTAEEKLVLKNNLNKEKQLPGRKHLFKENQESELKQSFEEKLISEEKTVFKVKQPSEEKAVVEVKQQSEEKTVVEVKQSSEEKTVVVKQPSEQKSVVEVKQFSEEKTVVEVKQSYEEKTIVEVKQSYEEKTVVEVKQPSEEKTVVDVKQSSEEKTVVEAKQRSEEKTVFEVNQPSEEKKVFEVKQPSEEKTVFEVKQPPEEKPVTQSTVNKLLNIEDDPVSEYQQAEEKELDTLQEQPDDVTCVQNVDIMNGNQAASYLIETEFGQYKIYNTNDSDYKIHQNKFSQRSLVKIVRLSENVVTASLRDNVITLDDNSDTENLNTVSELIDSEIEYDFANPLKENEVIVIDDSSSEDEVEIIGVKPLETLNSLNVFTGPKIDIRVLKEKLLEDLGLNTMNSEPVTPATNMDTNLDTLPKNIDDKLCQMCCVKLDNCDGLVEKYNELKKVTKKCVVNLVKCDNSCDNDDITSIEIGESNADTMDSIESDCIIIRSESPSILHDTSWIHCGADDDDILNIELPSEPDSISDICGRTSPVVEIFDVIAQLNTATNISKLTPINPLKCDADWFATKRRVNGIIRDTHDSKRYCFQEPKKLFRVESLVKTVLNLFNFSNTVNFFKAQKISTFSTSLNKSRSKRKLILSQNHIAGKIKRSSFESTQIKTEAPTQIHEVTNNNLDNSNAEKILNTVLLDPLSEVTSSTLMRKLNCTEVTTISTATNVCDNKLINELNVKSGSENYNLTNKDDFLPINNMNTVDSKHINKALILELSVLDFSTNKNDVDINLNQRCDEETNSSVQENDLLNIEGNVENTYEGRVLNSTDEQRGMLLISENCLDEVSESEKNKLNDDCITKYFLNNETPEPRDENVELIHNTKNQYEIKNQLAVNINANSEKLYSLSDTNIININSETKIKSIENMQSFMQLDGSIELSNNGDRYIENTNENLKKTETILCEGLEEKENSESSSSYEVNNIQQKPISDTKDKDKSDFVNNTKYLPNLDKQEEKLNALMCNPKCTFNYNNNKNILNEDCDKNKCVVEESNMLKSNKNLEAPLLKEFANNEQELRKNDVIDDHDYAMSSNSEKDIDSDTVSRFDLLNEQPGLILRGIEYKDSHVGTYYVFSPIGDSFDTGSLNTIESEVTNTQDEEVKANEVLAAKNDKMQLHEIVKTILKAETVTSPVTSAVSETSKKENNENVIKGCAVVAEYDIYETEKVKSEKNLTTPTTILEISSISAKSNDEFCYLEPLDENIASGNSNKLDNVENFTDNTSLIEKKVEIKTSILSNDVMILKHERQIETETKNLLLSRRKELLETINLSRSININNNLSEIADPLESFKKSITVDLDSNCFIKTNSTNSVEICEDLCDKNQTSREIVSLRDELLEILPPTKTYPINRLKRKLIHKEPKVQNKKYRKGKNIDCSKLTTFAMKQSNFGAEHKRLIEYMNTVKFSYARPYHKECIDVDDVFKNWPIQGPLSTASSSVHENKYELYTDYFVKPNNPLDQTLEDEMSYQCGEDNMNLTREPIQGEETNFNMGFGEGSDRVIPNSKESDNLKISAATLLDVKQYQPCSLTENYHVAQNSYNGAAEQIRRYVFYVQLKEKVRSYFNKVSVEMSEEHKYNKDITECKQVNKIFKNVPGLYETVCIKPCSLASCIQVVQVGQLPVSAAAQNPVTCDPRVTQVSDASPSQCSVESSPPSENNQTSIKAEYTELTTADLTLPIVRELSTQNQILPESPEDTSEQHVIPKEIEITSVITNQLDSLVDNSSSENNDDNSLSNNQQSIDYEFESRHSNENINISSQLAAEEMLFNDNSPQQNDDTFIIKRENGTSEKTDQIAHAMNAAGITTNENDVTDTATNSLVDITSPKIGQNVPTSNINATQTTNSTYSKTPINAMALQQALASILPSLNQISNENSQSPQSTVSTPVLHVVSQNKTSTNQITLVDNSQHSVISTPSTNQVLHIVQNKAGNVTNSNGAINNQTNSFSGISLVDAGLQQGGNQLLHFVNTGGQKNANAGQLLKRVNLLTNLTNVQGGNEQKMVQFVCKSADGKSIHLNAPHQRSMVLRLQPIETPNVTQTAKTSETQEVNQTQMASGQPLTNDSSQEIKSRSMYEENYAKFIQNSSTKSPVNDKSTSLPKFNQAFGKPVFQDGTEKQEELENTHLPSVHNSESNEQTENALNLEHINQIGNPPLLLRKTTPNTTQSTQNIVQQIKQTIAPMNIQTMHGGVIYTRQIPVNIGGGQTINLITVPSTELIDDSNQKQNEVKFVSQNEIEPSILKIVPQREGNTDGNTEDNMSTSNEVGQTPQPVLTQMRIKLPMLSKHSQVVPGTRVVRPSFFQIQRNVIGGANQPVYQQLVLTAAPSLGQQAIRLPQAQARTVKSNETPVTTESQLSSSTLEQLREFDMVLEQVKERSTVQPTSTSNTFSKLLTPSTDTTDSSQSTPVSTSSSDQTNPQVMYSIGNTPTINVAYVNRKQSVTTPVTTTFVRSPDSSGISDSPTSQTPSSSQGATETQVSSAPSPSPSTSHKHKIASKSVKNRPKPSSQTPSALKVNHIPPKTSTQKPLEDEQTTQRILYILAEYKEQVENSPDKDKPAPRRRTNPPSNPGSSKRKKGSCSSRRPGCTRDHSPIDDNCRTMGSEDSSCGTSQGDCNESCSIDAHSPQDSPRKVIRKLTFENNVEPQISTQLRPQPPRNVIVADGQTITVARSATGKPATAVLMPANYILPVSMVKGGQQIAIVTNRGPKLLTVGGTTEGGAANALLLQRLIGGPAGLKPVLARPGVRHVRLPTTAIHNLQAFNITAAQTQPADSTASPGPAPPELADTRANTSPWTERTDNNEQKLARTSSPETNEPWHHQATSESHDYSYEDGISSRSDTIDRTVLVVQKKDGSTTNLHRVTHFSSAALRHKYAILEHELRLQKSLSEECEDLGVDSPSAAELFPEAELLFTSSPAAHDHAHDQSQNSASVVVAQSSGPPELEEQIATDQLLQPEDLRSPSLELALDDVVHVEDATIALNHEEFARSHPNTTFHSEPTHDGEEVAPFSLSSSLKGRNLASTIFHSNTAPATVLMSTSQHTVISQAAIDTSLHNNVKYSDIDHMIDQLPSHANDINLSSVLVKDDGLTRFDNILTDSRELHLSHTASAIVHSNNVTQVIRRVYDDDKRDRFLLDDHDLIAGDDAKMSTEESSRDGTFESNNDPDDDGSSPEAHAELFWESNSERSDSRRPLDYSSDSEKCCKSPSLDETNSTDSSVGTHMRLDSVIKEARGRERSGSVDGSSADDSMMPPIRTYPAKRFHADGDAERSTSGKTRAGERSPDSQEVRRRASNRGVVKRGCHCCNGSPAPPRPKKPRKKPTIDFTDN